MVGSRVIPLLQEWRNYAVDIHAVIAKAICYVWLSGDAVIYLSVHLTQINLIWMEL